VPKKLKKTEKKLREIGDLNFFFFGDKENCHYCKILKWKEKTPGQWYPGCPRIFKKKTHKQQ
jgi:hypothetical protein